MNPPNLPLSRKSTTGARQSAFSLVEVVLAVGVISFAFVAILGLLPAGLAQFRQAMDNSVGAQIAQRIILDYQQTDFTTLTAGLSLPYGQPLTYDSTGKNPRTTRYFDEQGNEVITKLATPSPTELTGGGTTGTLGIVYFVNTRIAPATTLPGTVGSSSNAGIATVVVQVAFNPSGQPLTLLSTGDATNLLIDPTKLPRGAVKTYSAMIGRN